MSTSEKNLSAAQRRLITKLAGQIDQEHKRIRDALAEKLRLSNGIDERTYDYKRQMDAVRRDPWSLSTGEVRIMREDHEEDKLRTRVAVKAQDLVMDRAGQQLHRLQSQYQALTGRRYE